jgi:uncharacterized phage protein gp47/JayE
MADPIPPQIDYTSRDYASIRADLLARARLSLPDWDTSDPNDFGVVLVEAFAHMGDLMSYYIDRAANESALATATRRSSVLALSRDLGYDPAGWVPAVGTVTFSNSDVTDKTLPAGTLVVASVNKDGFIIEVPFETTASVTVPASSSASVAMTQGETISGEGNGVAIGTSAGSANSLFRLPSNNVVRNSVSVRVYDSVNYVPWTYVTRLQDYSGTDKVFTVRDDGYGGTYVQFGDGVGGQIPPNGHTVYATYQTCLGSNGNVATNTIREISAVPGLTSGQVAILVSTMTVTNPSITTGGADPEDLSSIRRNAAQAYRANNRAVTLEDYQSLALQVPGCGKASARSSTPGLVALSVTPSREFGGAEARPGFIWNGSAWVETQDYADLKSEVHDFVSSKMLAGTTLNITNVQYEFVVMTIDVVAIPSLSNASVETTVSNAILERLDYSLIGFGATISPSGLQALVSSLGITTSVTVSVLKKDGDPDAVNTLVADDDVVFLTVGANVTVNSTGGI